MNSAIKKLGEDDDREPMQSSRAPRKRAIKSITANKYSALDIEEASDADNSDFSDEIPVLQSGSDSESDGDADEQLTNDEVFSNAHASFTIAHSILFPACCHLAVKDSG
jgi:hypothetical protein